MKWLIFLCVQLVATGALAAPHNPLTQDTTAHAGELASPASPGTPACAAHSGSAPVMTAADAIASAKAAWQSIHDKASGQTDYSRESTARFEPYAATLKDGLWLVRGNIPAGYHGTVLESTVRVCDGNVTVTYVTVQ